MASPSIEQIPELVSEMRAAFDAGLTKPIDRRIAQLKALRRFFTENEDQVGARPIQHFFSRPSREAFYTNKCLYNPPEQACFTRLFSALSPLQSPPITRPLLDPGGTEE